MQRESADTRPDALEAHPGGTLQARLTQAAVSLSFILHRERETQ